MAVADSSWIVALLNQTDRHHDEALALLASAQTVVVVPIAATEATFVMEGAPRSGTRRQRRLAAAEALRLLLQTPTVRVRDAGDLQAAVALVQDRPYLSLPNALIALAAKGWNEDLWTFDTAQRTAYEGL